MGFISRALGTPRIMNLANGESATPIGIPNGVKVMNRVPSSALEEDYRFDPFTFNIINKDIQLIMRAGFKIKTKTARWQKKYDAFFESIGEIGEPFTKEEMVEYILQDELMYGNCFVEKVFRNGDYNDKMLDFNFISEKRMDYAKDASKNIVLDKYGNPIGYVMSMPRGYNSRGKGDPIPMEYKDKVSMDSNQIFFNPKRIAHFKLFTYGDRFYGLGLIEPAHVSTFRKLKIEEARTNEIYTRGSNTIIASVGDNEHEPSTEDIEKVLDNISNFKHDRYFSFPHWVKVNTLPLNENDSVDKTLDYLRINQSSSSGMPMAMVSGQGETANKQTLQTQQFILELSLEHIVKKFAAQFKKYILKPLAKSHDIPEVADIVFGDIIAEDKAGKNERLMAAVRNGVLSPEEVRPYIIQAEDLEEMPDKYKDFSDKFWVSKNKDPISPLLPDYEIPVQENESNSPTEEMS